MITAHADVVGSLLRPSWLLEAQERLRAEQIARPAYKSVEDRAVDEAVAQQEETGLCARSRYRMVAHWSLTTLRERLVKVGGRISGYRLAIAVARRFIARPSSYPPSLIHLPRSTTIAIESRSTITGLRPRILI